MRGGGEEAKSCEYPTLTHTSSAAVLDGGDNIY